ncbi:phosphatidic acid phosphatase type 2/haloperoxidase [Panaeolus papilionaceus]|nr:phosphatidic acid phosphatase type 2/haloperoxidase [Panaeolus papilionaceus]
MSYTRLSTPEPQQQPSHSSSRFSMTNFPFKATQPLSKGVSISPARRRKLIFSYLPDWVLTIALAVAFFLLDKVDGFRREFSLEDTSLRHPFAVHERVPNTALICVCFVAPILIMPIINFITVRSLWDLHNSSLGLVLSLALTGSITQLVKITVGRPRPDVISRCIPKAGSEDPPLGLSNSTICTQTNHAILLDGFRSFFSGHSSLSFAGMGFLAFYLAGKLHLFDRRGHTGKAWLALAPFMVALLVAISRTMDYRHHWQDVLVGSIVGTVLAFFGYHQYYPSLASEYSHRPYSPRIKREDDILPTHLQSAPFPGSNSPNHLNVNDAQGYRQQHSLDESYELAGTVPRPQPVTSMEDHWKSTGSDEGNGHGDLSSTAYNPSGPPQRMASQRGPNSDDLR